MMQCNIRIAGVQTWLCTFGKASTIFSSTIKTDQRNNLNRMVNEMNLIRSYSNWRRYRDTVSELNRLSTRELNDLGISRSDIPFVAKKSAVR